MPLLVLIGPLARNLNSDYGLAGVHDGGNDALDGIASQRGHAVSNGTADMILN